MTLIGLIVFPFLGGLLAWFAARFFSKAAHFVSLLVLTLSIGAIFLAWLQGESSTSMEDLWMLEWRWMWLPAWGVEVHFGLDGLSFILLLLTYVLGFIAVMVSKNEIVHSPGFFHFCLLWMVSGVAGILLSLDLFLFFVFWEVVLIPLYLMVLIWGHKNRIFATVQFFIFTQASGLLLFLGIIALVFVHHAQAGVYTFDYDQLINTSLPHPLSVWIVTGFLLAFLVKLPAFPFHVWMPPLFSESMCAPLLVGILVKTGAYGLLRFVLPLFVSEIPMFVPFMNILGVISIVYGAVLAFAQNDPFKVLAYSTLSHIGLILIGIFSQDKQALSGVVVLLVTQALSTGGLLMLFAHLKTSLLDLDLQKVGGLLKVVPGVTVLALFFVMASVGLPGLGNFVGEWLVLLGIFSTNSLIAIFAASGIVLGAIYFLWLVRRLFYGPYKSGNRAILDVSAGQKMMYGFMILLLIGLGFFPAPLLDVVSTVWQEKALDIEDEVFSPQISLKQSSIGKRL
jgi:NADH-quinone oxidoreductase subunit M